jgi:hypothetical protein
MNKSKQRVNLNRPSKTSFCENHKSDHSRHSGVKFEMIGQASTRPSMKYRRDGQKHRE